MSEYLKDAAEVVVAFILAFIVSTAALARTEINNCKGTTTQTSAVQKH